MRKTIILALGLLINLAVHAQTYNIDITRAKTDVLRGHLDLGGRNVKGDTIGVNSFYIERNGKPIIPVIGEQLAPELERSPAFLLCPTIQHRPPELDLVQGQPTPPGANRIEYGYGR